MKMLSLTVCDYMSEEDTVGCHCRMSLTVCDYMAEEDTVGCHSENSYGDRRFVRVRN